MTDSAGPTTRSVTIPDVISEESLLARRLPLAGTFNVRDVGGYPTVDGRHVAWGQLLRSDALHQLDDDGRKRLADFGLRTSIDLREPDERASAPDRLDPMVRMVSIPFFSFVPPGTPEWGCPPIDRRTITELDETYRLLIHDRGQVLVAAIRELLRPGALPAIVHCAIGKDRTGVLIALLLGAIGVPDEVIAADYAATQLFLTAEFRLTVKVRNDASGGTPSRLAAILRCEPELMRSLLEEIRSIYGDVAGYLLGEGMTAAELELLRQLLTTEA